MRYLRYLIRKKLSLITKINRFDLGESSFKIKEKSKRAEMRRKGFLTNIEMFHEIQKLVTGGASWTSNCLGGTNYNLFYYKLE